MTSLLTVRFPGDKPCSRSRPSLRSSLRCHGCQHCVGTGVPFAATLYRDLLTAAGFCTSFYPRMDHLLLTNTAVMFQAQNHVSGGCRSQVGCGGAATQHWHSLLSPGCWSCPQVLHPAQGWGAAGGRDGQGGLQHPHPVPDTKGWDVLCAGRSRKSSATGCSASPSLATLHCEATSHQP